MFKPFLKTLLNYSFAYFKIPFLVPQPVQLQIEPSAACNLKCQMCNLDKSNEKNKYLSLAKFKTLIKELKPLKSINFTGMGESLLHPNFIEILKIARQNKVDFTFITNGQLLNKKLSEKIIKLQPTAISFSVESGFPKTYEKIRKGAKYQKLTQNITDLMVIHKKLKSKTQIVLNCVFLKINTKNLNHIYKIIDLAKNLNIHKVTFQNPYILDIKLAEIKKIIPKISNYAKKKNVSIELPKTNFKPQSCYYPWVYPQLTASGELLPCCVIPQSDKYVNIIKNYSFGNVFENGFKKIWQGKLAFQFRLSHLKNTPLVCRRCTKFNNVL